MGKGEASAMRQTLSRSLELQRGRRGTSSAWVLWLDTQSGAPTSSLGRRRGFWLRRELHLQEGQDTEGPRSWTPSAQPAQDCNSGSTEEDRPLTHYVGHSSLSTGLCLESPRHHVSRCVHEGLSRRMRNHSE